MGAGLHGATLTYRYQPQRTVWAAMSHLCPTRDPRAINDNEPQSYFCLPCVLKLARNSQTLSEFFFKPNDSLSFRCPQYPGGPLPLGTCPSYPSPWLGVVYHELGLSILFCLVSQT